MNTSVIDAMQTYDGDFSAWADEQARALSEHRVENLDFANLAEEIASLGRSERRELRNRIRVLMMHLLKWGAQKEYRSRSWRSTIETQRRDIIEDVLKDNPSLRREADEMVRDRYERSVQDAMEETKLERFAFPQQCPFSFESIMNEKVDL